MIKKTLPQVYYFSQLPKRKKKRGVQVDSKTQHARLRTTMDSKKGF